MTILGTAQRSRTPTGMKVAAMSYKKLEVVADGVRPLLPTVSGYGGGPWKIDALRVLEVTMQRSGLNYAVWEDDRLKDVAAFTIPEQSLVVIRQDVYDGLEREQVFSRSTVIHELSHIVLRHAVTLHRGAAVGAHQFYEDSEWQAKALTVAIMMPINACKAAHSAQELAEVCGTSVQAATYRLERLIKENVLDPQRYAGQLFSFPPSGPAPQGG